MTISLLFCKSNLVYVFSIVDNRRPANTITAIMDLSMVYGSSDAENEELRDQNERKEPQQPTQILHKLTSIMYLLFRGI